jgi:hypothetical protein
MATTCFLAGFHFGRGAEFSEFSAQYIRFVLRHRLYILGVFLNEVNTSAHFGCSVEPRAVLSSDYVDLQSARMPRQKPVWKQHGGWRSHPRLFGGNAPRQIDLATPDMYPPPHPTSAAVPSARFSFQSQKPPTPHCRHISSQHFTTPVSSIRNTSTNYLLPQIHSRG